MADLVTTEEPREGVALVTLDLEPSGGFVSWAAVSALADALEQAREGGARVSVLAGAVQGQWYEHAWLPDLINMMKGEPTSGDSVGWFRALKELVRTHVVSIAAISGSCSGGGAELGWACDLRIAEEQATFGQPEVMLGVATGIGGTSRLARLIGRTVTAEMVLDGTPISAQRIYELGGVNRVVPTGQAVEAAVEWASRLAARPAASLATLKQMLMDSDNKHLDDALGNEQALFQKVASRPKAIESMGRAQSRFEAGESVLDVYGPKRS
jgi:enoyl-CoA hydratase/carnithine racemase